MSFPISRIGKRRSNPMGNSPVILTKSAKFRQPVVTPIPKIVTVDGDKMPIPMDAVMIAVANVWEFRVMGKTVSERG